MNLQKHPVSTYPLLKPHVPNLPEPVLTPVPYIKVFRPYVAYHFHISEDASRPDSSHLPINPMVFIPTLAATGPNKRLHDFVSICIHLGYDFWLHVNKLDVLFRHLSNPLRHVFGAQAEAGH